MAPRFALRSVFVVAAVLTALAACFMTLSAPAQASGHGTKGARPQAHGSPSRKRRPATPFASVKALQARIEDMKEAAEKKKLDEEASGTDFLDSVLYYLRQRAYPHDSVDFSAYARGVAQRDRLAPAVIGPKRKITDTFVPSNHWQFVGPTNLGVPYNPYYGNGPLSGRVNALAYDPTAPNTYYLVAGGGGVWKTTNGGAAWTSLSNSWKYQQASCIALDPNNHNTLYVGTGDIAYASYASGVMKSTNGGTTWTDLGVSTFGTDGVNALIIDPETTTTITAAAGNRDFGYVYRSTDGGTTWSRVLTQQGIWTDLKYGAKNTSGVRHYYTATAYANASTSEQLWRSDDRGMTWTQLTIPATGYNYTEGLVVAPSATAPDTVYLESGYDQILWKSTDAGATWTDITSGLTAVEPGLPAVGDPTYNWSQGSYDIALNCVAGAGGADTLYDSLIDLARSTNGGTTWASLGGPTYNQNNGSVLHNDQHAFAVNPADPTDFLVGCDGGVYHYVFPSGAASPTITSLNQAVGITQFYKAAYHPTNPNIIVAGAQDNGSPLCQGTLTTWGNSPSGGDGGGCAINQTNPNDQYSTSQDLTVVHTTDGWNNVANDISPPVPSSESPPFVGVLTLDPSSPNLLYTGTQYLYQHNSTTGNWTEFTNQALTTTIAAPNAGILQAIAVAPSNGQVIYTGSSEGNVWMTTNRGTTWTEIDGVTGGASPLPGRAITSIDISPTNPDDILVGLSGTGGGHLYRCADTTQGVNCVWANLSGSGSSALPDVPLNAVTRDPDQPTSTFYAGTDIGVFATTDGGMDWTNATTPLGLPNVQVNDLKAVPGTHYLNAATYGRGIWRISLTATVTPMISGFSPTSGLVGTSITLTGSGFTGATSVAFNGTMATFTVVSATQITTTVPSGAATGTISVTTAGGTATSASSFTVVTPPAITSFTPTSGRVGTSVTLTGTGFSGATSVKFNGTTATFTVVSDTSITVPVPSGATTGPISVTTPGGTAASSTDFTVYPLPTIASFSPTNGPVGTSVTITGTGFTGATAVKFNGTTAAFTVVSSTQITTTVPSGAMTGQISVTTPGGTATSTASFTVTTVPFISSFTPTSGVAGTTVTISGLNFTGATSVAFNGTAAASFSVASGTSITATVANGTTTGPISVTTASGTGTSTSNFTIIPPPVVSGFTPPSGLIGTSVTLTGSGFTGATSVAFNGTPATFTVVSDAHITATVPSGATTGPVSVTTPGGTAMSSSSFIVNPVPVVTGFSPANGLPGTSVTITGSGLTGATVVKFNQTFAVFSVLSSSSISTTVPTGATTGKISVTTSAGTGMSASSFTVDPVPVITGFSPANGLVGASVTVTGSGFTGATSVKFNGISAVFTLGSSTSITTTVPSGATTGPITVTTPNGSGTSATDFTVTVPPSPPTIASFSPASGLVGTSVTVTGTGFAGATSVKFNGTTATFTVGSATQITTIVPSGATTGRISVTTPNGTGTSSANFTVTMPASPPTITGISPTSGTVGTTVTITGTNLTGATSVTINGVSVLFTVVNGTTITFTVPAGITGGVITITTPGGTVTSGNITFTVLIWNVRDVAAASDGTARLLWNRSDHAAIVWTLNAADAMTGNTTTFGPYSDSHGIWTAKAVRVAPDRTMRLLWTRSDGAAGVWTLSAAGAQTVVGPTYGPYADSHGTWTATGLGVAPDGTVRLLWTRSDGAASAWTLTTSDVQGTLGPTYGPYSDTHGTWSAQGIGVAGDGTSRLLWTRSDKAMGVWSLGTNNVQTAVGPTYGPYPAGSLTWNATGIGTSSDGTSRILWVRSDGAAGLWTFSTSDTETTMGTVYGPYSGFAATAVDTVLDQSRVLWVRSDRAAGIWTFNSADTETVIGSVYGPY